MLCPDLLHNKIFPYENNDVTTEPHINVGLNMRVREPNQIHPLTITVNPAQPLVHCLTGSLVTAHSMSGVGSHSLGSWRRQISLQQIHLCF
jgi:hypothetical protein